MRAQHKTLAQPPEAKEIGGEPLNIAVIFTIFPKNNVFLRHIFGLNFCSKHDFYLLQSVLLRPRSLRSGVFGLPFIIPLLVSLLIF